MNNGNNIPKYLPLSTLACPPSGDYIKEYIYNNGHDQYGSRCNTTGQTGPNLRTHNIVQSMSQRLINTNTISGKILTNNDSVKLNKKGLVPEFYVKKWVDYSTRYGLGYILSNNSCGVFFNDCTKMILDPTKDYLEYIERRSIDKVDILSCYSFKSYPKELHKKVTLLQHFRSYLEGSKTNPTTPSENAEKLKPKEIPLVYLKKWIKIKNAIMFRLINKVVQVDFQDKTQIVLSSESKLVTYVNKKGESSQYAIATALESENAEMSKRLKYTKEILTYMLNNNSMPDTK